MNKEKKPSFASDYMEGAHPLILQRLLETNLEKTAGYGLDEYSGSARDKIRAACRTPEAEVFFLAGGTQTNAVIIDALLRPWQGVISARSGHVSVHEAGAIEFGGHKVLALPHRDGKLAAETVRNCMEEYLQDANRDHMVMPGMVYLSHPTEYGTLYSLEELREISSVCREYRIPLYLDGARLAYALACPENDITMPDLGALCDAFYIGGTKCGTLFGEAAVIPDPKLVPHLFTMIKQHGALLAKGRIAGLQFDVLFTDGLYERIGLPAIEAAGRIREALLARGYQLTPFSPTNQIFILLDKAQAAALSEKVEMSFIEQTEDGKIIMRIVTSWATKPEDVDRLIARL
uniref:Low specificity L-threonine aldolase n=1 Tax=uncultured bacterium Contig15 TaxID=1393441 RepID=W0FGV9_9BACT|nr:low specificity L-threonine aldolase [uncultured bacterium Contig15]